MAATSSLYGLKPCEAKADGGLVIQPRTPESSSVRHWILGSATFVRGKGIAPQTPVCGRLWRRFVATVDSSDRQLRFVAVFGHLPKGRSRSGAAFHTLEPVLSISLPTSIAPRRAVATYDPRSGVTVLSKAAEDGEMA
jgi:hypothetical protein